MKVIILAAGRGTRLGELTSSKPKCMVEVLGKPIIKHQLDLLSSNNISEIYVATGYMSDKINFPSITKKFYNKDYLTTNMVHSLFKCKDILIDDDDLLITYGDIIYNKNILNKVVNFNSSIGVVVDKSWEKYWQVRMNNPLNDAETLKLNNKNEIIEIGKKPNSIDDIEGQYIGMIKINKNFINKFVSFYNSLNKNIFYDGKDFKNMYMTSFLQKITDDLQSINSIAINNGWMEIDEPSDLKFTDFLNAK